MHLSNLNFFLSWKRYQLRGESRITPVAPVELGLVSNIAMLSSSLSWAVFLHTMHVHVSAWMLLVIKKVRRHSWGRFWNYLYRLIASMAAALAMVHGTCRLNPDTT